MKALERILTALNNHGIEPRKTGDGWLCRCPAHDDRNPSLSIDIGNDGRVLLNCHAGCATDAICGAVGLKLADLFPDDPSRRNGNTSNPRQRGPGDTTPRNPARNLSSVSVSSVKTPARTFPTANEALAELKRRHGQPAAMWTYRNAAGEPVGLVVRWNTPTGKDVRPVSRTADGSGWYIGGMPTPRPLYRLPELLAMPGGSRVWILEGEKAADAAARLGLVATTSPHGAKSAAKADWSCVRGHHVVVSVDHDNAGERYGADAARLCLAAGAKSVRIVRLIELWAELPEGGDMADFVEHRGDDAAARAEVEALADKAEPMEAETNPPAALEFVPFPVHTLPEPIRGFVTDAAAAIRCEPSYIAVPLLAALAAAIGNTHRLRVSNTWHAPPILWAAIIGESGSMKSPAFKLAMNATQAAQAAAFKQNALDRKESEADLLRYEAALMAWRRDAIKSKESDAYTIAPPEKPELPKARRYIVSDTTVEALVPILLDNPRGVLLARDELAGWLGSFDRYSKGGKGGADSAHYLSMHDGASLTLDRKTGTPPTIHVPSAAVSIAGCIQPGILARSMGQEHHESGMLARLLFAMPPRKPKRWTEADVDPATEAAVVAVFNRLFGLTMELDPESPTAEPEYRPRLKTMTSEAKAEWVRFYNEHNADGDELIGDDAAAWSKLEGYVPRVALVLHLTRWAARDATLSDPSSVDRASMAAAIELVRWFGNETKRVYAVLGESDDDRNSRLLVDFIRAKGGTVTTRQLMRGGPFCNTASDAEALLGALVNEGRGHWETQPPGPNGGPPPRRFRLSDRTDADKTPENPVDFGGSVSDTAGNWGTL